VINRRPLQTRKREQWVDVPKPEGTYADATRPFSQQDVVNYLKESAEAQGTRSDFKLLGVPGLKPRASIGDGPFRGARNVESKRFAVLGNYLYQFNKAMTTADQLGYVPGLSLVQMSHNQIAGGHEVAIATGSAGYIYNTVTGDFAKITDSSFSGGKSVTFIDQMFVWVDAQGRFFQPSDIAAGTVYTALEEQEAEMAPDRIQCALAAHQELLVGGKNTLQFYQSTGDPEELFADKKSGIDVGFASPHCAVLIDNTVIWVDEKGVGRRLNGGIAQRITTHPIEKDWAECNLSKCSAFVWEDRGHAVVYFQFPDGKTWGYDCATQRFHRRKSKDMDRWMVNGLVQWDGVWYAGAFNSGTIYEMDWDYPLEGCDELLGDVTAPGLHNSGNRVQVDGVRVQFDTGHETVTCVDVDPINPATYIESIVAQGGQGWLVARFNTSELTTEVLAYHAEDTVYYQSRPWKMGDYYAIPYAWSAETSKAVAIYSRAGSTLTLVDSIDNDANREFLGAVKLSETRFIALWNDPNTFKQTVELCNFDGSAITVVDSETNLTETYGTPDYLCSCLCEGKAIFYLHGELDDRFMVCSVSGDVLTVAYSATFGNVYQGVGLAAIGDKISAGKGRIWSVSGSTVTEVQGTAEAASCAVTTDGTRFFYAGFGVASFSRLASSPYTKTTYATTFESAPGGDGGYVFCPGDDQSFGANEHGVLQFGTAFTEIAPFAFDEIDEGDITNLLATVVETP